jgi:Right handed beta helix region
MFRIKTVLLLSAVLLACLPSASATVTYYVGSCMAGSYPNISDALAATVAPDVVKVCPGTYADQVFITRPVTLEGISTSGSDQVFITQPTGGLPGFCRDVGDGIQLCVSGASPVNISNITVDGTGTSKATGIYYKNSTGTLNHVETRFQENGIYVDGGTGTVTIENSNVHSFSRYGIFASGSSGTGFSVTVQGNTVIAEPTASVGIDSDMGVGADLSLTISSNFVSGPSKGTGIVINAATGSVSNNTITAATHGIATESVVPVTSNAIYNVSGTAIELESSVAKVQGNTITQAENGIDYECIAGSNVGSNTISVIHSTGIIDVPKAATTTNTYYNVPTIRSGGC